MDIRTGMTDEARTQVGEGLKKVLADMYFLYQKTHVFHWNVEGPMFHTLHTLFEQHYSELWTDMDEFAERIRALGLYAPSTQKQFQHLATIAESDANPDAREMVEELLDGREKLVATCRKTIKLAEDAGDEVTVDMLIGRMTTDEKTAWMLRSLLVEQQKPLSLKETKAA